MRSKWYVVLIAIMISVSAVGMAARPTPAAAGGSWSAWIYNREAGRLVHIFPDDVAPEEMAFPLPPGTSLYPDTLTISRDGAYLAACLRSDAGESSVRVYDITQKQYVAAYVVPGTLEGCSLTQYAFSEDNTQVAFGIFNHWPNTPDDSRPDWEVIIMEVGTSAIVQRIATTDPAITALGRDYGGHLPFVVTFQMRTPTFPGVIAFKPVRWGTEGQCEYDSLVWQLDNNAITLNGPYGKSSFDVLLANSEITWTDENSEYTPALLLGPGCAHNVVMYANKAGAMYPIFHDGSHTLWNSVFIQGGERIAVNSYSSADDISSWIAIDRTGATFPLAPEIERDMRGTPDGYVFLATGPFGVPEVRYQRLTTGETFVLWNGLAGETWRMVWVNPLSEGTGLPPFPPLEATNAPQAVPLAPPVTAGEVAIGGRIQINTTAGDQLRVRSGPGLSFDVLAQLPAGTQGTVIEGPKFSDGYTWWRIQLDDGRAGWAVEGVIDNGAYLPTLLPIP